MSIGRKAAVDRFRDAIAFTRALAADDDDGAARLFDGLSHKEREEVAVGLGLILALVVEGAGIDWDDLAEWVGELS